VNKLPYSGGFGELKTVPTADDTGSFGQIVASHLKPITKQSNPINCRREKEAIHDGVRLQPSISGRLGLLAINREIKVLLHSNSTSAVHYY
jgi:hypothetical protein